MALVVQPGDCFWINYGGRLPHFYFVISAPDTFPERRLVMVSMTKISPDKTVRDPCYLHPGEHHTCSIESFIDFHFALSLSALQLAHLIQEGKAQARPPRLCDAILERLRQGAQETRRLQGDIRRELWEQGIVTL